MKYLEAQSLAKKAGDTKGSGRKSRPGPAENKVAPAPVATKQEPAEMEKVEREDDFTRTESLEGADATSPESPESPDATRSAARTTPDEKSEKPTKGRKSGDK